MVNAQLGEAPLFALDDPARTEANITATRRHANL